MKKSSTTPTPWEVEADDERYGVYHLTNYGHDALKTRDYDLYAVQHEANAEFIQRAVNNHDALLEALEWAVEATERHNEGGSLDYDWIGTAIDTIQKAKGETT